jgi:uncharacterized RDD family membrane protein YckC
MNEEELKLNYAAWWRRFVACLIDFVVLLPLIIPLARAMTKTPHLYAILLVPVSAIYCLYFVICHGLWGRTLGKRLTGIRVASLDGRAITWRQAFIRHVVEITCVILSWVALVPVFLSMPAEGYPALSSKEQLEMIRSLWPKWYRIVDEFNTIWVWSEVVVILFNERRRALHDFIAGTIVVQTTPARCEATQQDQYNVDLEKEMKRCRNL